MDAGLCALSGKMVALAEARTLKYISAGTLSTFYYSPIIAKAQSTGSCADADWALYHDPNESAARALPTRANGPLSLASRRNRGAFRQVWESRRVAIPVVPHSSWSGGNTV